MTRILHVSQGWDLSKYGQCDITFTDSSGGPYTVSMTVGRFMHPDIGSTLTHPSTTGVATVTVANPYTQFATEVQSFLNAHASPRVYTVTWSPTTCRYTISVDSGTVAFTWSTPNQVRLRDLLGFTGGSTGGAASHTSTVCPRYAIEPAIPYLQNWIDFVAQPDRVRKSQTDGGAFTTVRPNLLPYRTSWEHAFEADAQAMRWRQVVADTPLWTWSDLWNDGVASAEWCFLREKAAAPHPTLDRKFAFQVANVDFTEDVMRKTNRAMPDFNTIRVDALLRGYS